MEHQETDPIEPGRACLIDDPERFGWSLEWEDGEGTEGSLADIDPDGNVSSLFATPVSELVTLSHPSEARIGAYVSEDCGPTGRRSAGVIAFDEAEDLAFTATIYDHQTGESWRWFHRLGRTIPPRGVEINEMLFSGVTNEGAFSCE